MIKSKKILTVLSSVFLIIEALLGVLLQTSQGSIPINLRYTAVVFACLFCIVFAEKTVSFLFTQIALVGTVAADYFLVYIMEMQQLPAMIIFSLVQIAYFMRLYFEDGNKSRRMLHLIIRVALSLLVLVVTVTVLGKSCDAVALSSMFYYTNLVLNAVFSFASFKRNYLLAIGFLLFILCDTVIGFAFIEDYLPISQDSVIYKIISPGFDLSWAFYLPSQALLSISLLPERLRKNDL